MNNVSKIVPFLLINLFGFFAVGICYALGIVLGAATLTDPALNVHSIQTWFFTGTMVTWLVCALFSLSYFFLEGKIKLVFLWAPVYVPFAYGLSILFVP